MKNPNMAIHTTKEAVQFLENLGYTQKSKNGGSHVIYQCPGLGTISLPDGGKNRISEGVKRNILKLALGDKYYV